MAHTTISKHSQNFEKLQEKIEYLEKRIEYLSALDMPAMIQGPRGIQGIRGNDGRDGRDGKDGKDGDIAVAEDNLVEKVLHRLQSQKDVFINDLPASK